MLNISIGAIIVLIASVIFIFIFLIAINIALVVKLRSAIPRSPHARPSGSLHRAPASKNGQAMTTGNRPEGAA
jgi:hypothetical protein